MATRLTSSLRALHMVSSKKLDTPRRGLTSGPLPLGNVWSPSLPVGFAIAVLLEALFLLAEVFLILNENHAVCTSRLKLRRGLLMKVGWGLSLTENGGVEIFARVQEE